MKIVLGLPCVFLIVVFVSWHFEIGINVTPSLPRGLYMSVDGAPTHGDIVRFCLEDEEFIKMAHENEYIASGSCESGLRPLLKIVAGMPGDIVSIQENGIYITKQNKTLACVWPCFQKSTDSQGRSIHSVLQNGVIPENKMLVLTMHPGSFDSRYFGLVPLKNLQRVMKIFTF